MEGHCCHSAAGCPHLSSCGRGVGPVLVRTRCPVAQDGPASLLQSSKGVRCGGGGLCFRAGPVRTAWALAAEGNDLFCRARCLMQFEGLWYFLILLRVYLVIKVLGEAVAGQLTTRKMAQCSFSWRNFLEISNCFPIVFFIKTYTDDISRNDFNRSLPGRTFVFYKNL